MINLKILDHYPYQWFHWRNKERREQGTTHVQLDICGIYPCTEPIAYWMIGHQALKDLNGLGMSEDSVSRPHLAINVVGLETLLHSSTLVFHCIIEHLSANCGLFSTSVVALRNLQEYLLRSKLPVSNRAYECALNCFIWDISQVCAIFLSQKVHHNL